MPIHLEYPKEYMEVMCSMYANYAPLKNIKETLDYMFPHIKSPCVETIKDMMTHLFGERVKSTAGTGRKLYSLYLCKEVEEFVEGLPNSTDKSELINSVLLMFVRQYNLRKHKLDAEREERLAKLEQMNRDFYDTHKIPTDR